MSLADQPNVRFDYVGALTLASKLHHLADQMERLDTTRSEKAATARAHWTGPTEVEFGRAAEADGSAMTAYITNLRQGASNWAAAWARAFDRQNAINYARAVEARRMITQVAATTTTSTTTIPGTPDPLAPPAPVRVPIGPDYRPTADRFYG